MSLRVISQMANGTLLSRFAADVFLEFNLKCAYRACISPGYPKWRNKAKPAG